MKPQTDFWTRRRFLQTSAVGGGSIRTAKATHDPNPALFALETSFSFQQQKRRKELWGLLGGLPLQHKPGPARLIGKEDHDGYTLERLVLDLNGVEPVPALLLIPTKRQPRAPGLLYIHWHGGMYDLGKEQLLKGVPAQPAYAPVCAEKGIVTLAIDSWCFGERKHVADGGQGEQDAFKLMLWYGQVLYGMMMLTNSVQWITWQAGRRLTMTGLEFWACRWGRRRPGGWPLLIRGSKFAWMCVA